MAAMAVRAACPPPPLQTAHSSLRPCCLCGGSPSSFSHRLLQRLQWRSSHLRRRSMFSVERRSIPVFFFQTALKAAAGDVLKSEDDGGGRRGGGEGDVRQDRASTPWWLSPSTSDAESEDDDDEGTEAMPLPTLEWADWLEELSAQEAMLDGKERHESAEIATSELEKENGIKQERRDEESKEEDENEDDEEVDQAMAIAELGVKDEDDWEELDDLEEDETDGENSGRVGEGDRESNHYASLGALNGEYVVSEDGERKVAQEGGGGWVPSPDHEEKRSIFGGPFGKRQRQWMRSISTPREEPWLMESIMMEERQKWLEEEVRLMTMIKEERVRKHIDRKALKLVEREEKRERIAKALGKSEMDVNMDDFRKAGTEIEQEGDEREAASFSSGSDTPSEPTSSSTFSIEKSGIEKVIAALKESAEAARPAIDEKHNVEEDEDILMEEPPPVREVFINSPVASMERLAIVENGKLVELVVDPLDSRNRKQVGEVYLGVVQGLAPKMPGAFVDIGNLAHHGLYQGSFMEVNFKRRNFPMTFPRIHPYAPVLPHRPQEPQDAESNGATADNEVVIRKEEGESDGEEEDEEGEVEEDEREEVALSIPIGSHKRYTPGEGEAEGEEDEEAEDDDLDEDLEEEDRGGEEEAAVSMTSNSKDWSHIRAGERSDEVVETEIEGDLDEDLEETLEELEQILSWQGGKPDFQHRSEHKPFLPISPVTDPIDKLSQEQILENAGATWPANRARPAFYLGPQKWMEVEGGLGATNRWANLRPGMVVVVQVLKEKLRQKEARLTSIIQLPGRLLTLVPSSSRISFSPKIQNEQEVQRLQQIMKELLPPQMGCTIHFLAEGCEKDELARDLQRLLDMWQRITEEAVAAVERAAEGDFAAVPKLLLPAVGRIMTVVREYFNSKVSRMVVDSESTYKEIMAYLDIVAPDLRDRVELYVGAEPIFDAYNIEPQLERLTSKRVDLATGGNLVVEETEAMWVIDVNGGKRVVGVDGENIQMKDAILAVNLEAARQAATEIRLRDIGGIIAVDLITMTDENHKSRVVREMKRATARDRVLVQVLDINEFGVMMLTRKRVRQSLMQTFSEPCESCEGAGRVEGTEAIMMRLEIALWRIKAAYPDLAISEKERSNTSKWPFLLIRVDPSTLQFLQGAGNERLDALSQALGLKFSLKAQHHFKRGQFLISRRQAKPLQKAAPTLELGDYGLETLFSDGKVLSR